WSRLTAKGALIGMIVGAATVLLWKNYVDSQLYEIVPGFILCGLAAIVVSLIDKKPSATMLQTFDKVNQIMIDSRR
ncbi:sodium:proline symporter, partial [Micrococcus luteus]|nr:sodium:proline symporter [Micrococcus luteus]